MGCLLSFPRRRESIIFVKESRKLNVMKLRKINSDFLSLLFSFLFILSVNILSSCNIKNDINTRSNECGKHKVDSLISQIVLTQGVYTPWIGTDSRYRYLALGKLQTKRDTLIGFDGVIFKIIKDSVWYRPGTITVDSVYFNGDSSKVKVELGFYIENSFRVNTFETTYKLDSNLCKWVIEKYSESIH